MEIRLTLAPGQNGTKKLLATYGDKLVCVRYRYDPERRIRHKTVEIVVETVPWQPRRRNPRRQPIDLVGVRIAYDEAELRQRVKDAGGIWRARQRLWEIDWATVRRLGIEDRVATE